MTSTRTRRSLALATLALVGAGTASGQIVYVDASGTPPGSGTSSDPFTSLVYALDHLISGTTTVEVAPGTYLGDIRIGGNLIVTAPAGPELTSLVSDGTGALAAVSLWGGQYPKIEGFTVTGVQDARPAIRIGSGTLGHIEKCVIRDNGGVGITGVYDAQIYDCTIVSNRQGVSTQSGFAFWSMTNTIVWSNDLPSSFAAAGGCVQYNILDSGHQSFCNPASNLFVKPGFWARDLSDLHLRPGSPAIDAGNPAAPLDPDGTRTDIGAYKFSPTYAPTAPQTYCTSRINSKGCEPEVAWSGSPTAAGSPFTIDCTKVLNNKVGLFFYGFAGKAAPYQGGYLCVQAPARRTPVQSSGGNPPPDDCSGAYSFDFDALIQSGADPLLLAGQGVFGQFWYRDSQQSGPFTTGRSEALAFEIGP